MARSIATNTTVALAELLDFVRPRHRLLLATTRRDARPQISPVSGSDRDWWIPRRCGRATRRAAL